jgi:hypothetical protein
MAAYIVSSTAAAQNAAPSYEAAPNVYKVIFEDPSFRVISATWPKGLQDPPHAHPLPSIIYYLTDCSLKLTTPDGQFRVADGNAGTSRANPVTMSHTAENVGSAECRAVLVERK